MSDPSTLKEWIVFSASALEGIVSEPRHEAELLLRAFYNKDALWLIRNEMTVLDDTQRLRQWITRRAANEPLEYISQRVSFYSQEFFIQQGALIPRPETELLIEKTLLHVNPDEHLCIVEVGIGSGIISIILAQHLPHAHFIGVDISTEALRIAQRNIECFGLKERIELRHGNLLSSVSEPIDVVVSNPPYIADTAVLESNLSYEPDTALFGGSQGDEIIKALLDEVLQRRVALLTCEMGYDQKAAIEAYLSDFKIQSLEFYKDYSGFDRGFIMKVTDEQTQ